MAKGGQGKGGQDKGGNGKGGKGTPPTGDAENNELVGGRGNDKISGLAGDDILIGNGGNDRLRGGLDNDHLDGGKGNDWLFGDEGKDVLIGGPGNDFLTGGADDDIFKFGGTEGDTSKHASRWGKDTITDFEQGVGELGDKIDLTALNLTSEQQTELLEGIRYSEGKAIITTDFGRIHLKNFDGILSGTDFKFSNPVDEVSPTVTIDIEDDSLNEDGTLTVTFSFSEALQVGSFTTDDITPVGGSIIADSLTQTEDPLVWTASYSLDPSFEGEGKVKVEAEEFSDAAGNLNGQVAFDTVILPLPEDIAFG